VAVLSGEITDEFRNVLTWVLSDSVSRVAHFIGREGNAVSARRSDVNGATAVEINGDIGAPEPLLLTPEQAAITLAICRTKVYELMGSGKLESVRIGSSRRIPVAAVVEFVQRLRGDVR
jgi:excisionase family DNA binding protein